MWCLLSNYLNMFRASLCPSSGEQYCALPHMVFCTGSDGCGCVELGCKHTACIPSPHSQSHHYQCRTPYAAVVLLMMGIMMPETCWDRSLIINIRLIASCWCLSLHPTFMMHGHKSLKKIYRWCSYRNSNTTPTDSMHEVLLLKSNFLDL